MIQCLLLANHKENEWKWGKDVFKCKPGQFITSLKNLAFVCARDVRVQSVRSALLALEKWHFLTIQSTKTGRLISVLNWEDYQINDDEEQQTPQQRANKEPTKSQQRANKEPTTNKNDKNVKNEKNVKKKSKRGFTTPTILEIKEYCIERNNDIDAEQFYHHYEARGWILNNGKKMVSWKSSIITWEKNERKKNKSKVYIEEDKKYNF